MTDQEAKEKQPLTWGSVKQIRQQVGILLTVVACWGLVLGVIMAPQPQDDLPAVVAGEALTWDQHIYPIMQRHCTLCHGASGGLSLATYESALAGGVNGPAIIPGDAENSLLYVLLLGPAQGIPAMPLGQATLPQATIDLIGQWIDQLPAAD